ENAYEHRRCQHHADHAGVEPLGFEPDRKERQLDATGHEYGGIKRCQPWCKAELPLVQRPPPAVFADRIMRHDSYTACDGFHMTNAPLALAAVPPDGLDDEYRALQGALSESARGRAFLSEYGRRNRNADTEALLAAVERIEARLRADASAVQRLRDDLRML